MNQNFTSVIKTGMKHYEPLPKKGVQVLVTYNYLKWL